MLLHMMELKGRFNGKMIKRARFGDVYFDEMGGFESVEREKGSGNVRFCFSFYSVSGSNTDDLAGCREEGAHLQASARHARTACPQRRRGPAK
jgi:hypothetical protein